jgi:glycosyltransferase involved in cell wall biosynthesis
MRILVVTPYLPFRNKARPFNFIRGLASAHEVTLVAEVEPAAGRDAPAHPDWDELRGMCSEIVLVRQPKRRSYANCVTALATGEPLRVAYCRSPALERVVQMKLDGDGFDVVHVDRERLAPLGAAVNGHPRVLDYTDAVSASNRSLVAIEPRPHWRLMLELDARRLERFERAARASFDEALVTTQADRDALGGGGVDDVTVVPNGVDTEVFTPMPGTERRGQLAFVGVMSYIPNVDAARFLATDALHQIREERPDAVLELVGADPAPAVSRLASSCVRVTGRLPDVRPSIAAAEVVAIPVRAGGGFPNKLAEAMAMGKAIVASPEVAGRLRVVPGVHVEVADRGAFAATVLDLLADADRRTRLAAEARAFAERELRWEPVLRKLVESYERARER